MHQFIRAQAYYVSADAAILHPHKVLKHFNCHLTSSQKFANNAQ